MLLLPVDESSDLALSAASVKQQTPNVRNEVEFAESSSAHHAKLILHSSICSNS